MADTDTDTSNPQTQETDDNNAIFDNDIDFVENSLLQKFTPKEDEEPEEDAESEPEENEQDIVSEDDSEDTEADEESEDEESDDDESDISDQDEERLQGIIEKRLKRELKKFRKEQEELTEQLKEKVKEAETPTDALSQVKSTMKIKDLDRIEAEAEKTIDFVEDNPDGFTINEGKDDERFVDRKELLDMKRNAREALKASKQRRKLIEQKNTFDAEVYKAFPSLEDKGSEEYVAIESVFNELPFLREHPKGTAYAIYLLRGEQEYSKPASKQVKKKAAKKAPKLPESKPQPKKAASSTVKKSDLQDAISQGGDQQSLEAALLSRFS
jgi:X-linked retinitis pigmentosa GTPase regulator